MIKPRDGPRHKGGGQVGEATWPGVANGGSMKIKSTISAGIIAESSYAVNGVVTDVTIYELYA